MKNRVFGKTGRKVSEIGFGAWAIGGSWGEVSEENARAALNTALDQGTTFIDTADVYGDGRSERIIADVLKDRGGTKPFIATKAGRRLTPHVADGYNKANLTTFVDRSLKNLQTDCLDLVQLHCPPTDVYYRPQVIEALEDLIAQGKIRNYGVSVEKVEEALKAIEYPGVVSVQIIYNVFRQRPAELFLQQAKARNIAVIARVPLASGLLTGKMNKQTQFAADDHRAFNRNGEAFDKGETFSGVPYDVALEAVEQIRPLVAPGFTMAQLALAWILSNDAITTVIPGAKNAMQASANVGADKYPPLSDITLKQLATIYGEKIRSQVHHLW
jgi:aryl-alcohol dehydrogenase-like predicted oxidoreductase